MKTTVEAYNPQKHPLPDVLAQMHLSLRKWQEEQGQNRFSKTDDSLLDIGDLENYYIAQGGNFFVAQDNDDNTIGFVGLRNDGEGQGSIKRLAVMPENHRQGIGSALVGATVDWASKNEFSQIKLFTNKGENARPVYEKFGFTVVDFLPDKGIQGDWVMELNLAQ